MALYDPVQHRSLATRFGADVGVVTLSCRSLVLWLLGYPEAALADADHALKSAREIGQAATLMHALNAATLTHVWCGNYVAAKAQYDEQLALADEKGTPVWKAWGMVNKGSLLASIGRASNAVQMITSGIAALRSTGARLAMPRLLSSLAKAYAELGQFDDAWRCIGEAMSETETPGQRSGEAEILANRWGNRADVAGAGCCKS